MSLFVFMGRRREIVEFPEKKADKSPLIRSKPGALHLGPGTVELTEDEERYLEKKRPDVWRKLSRRSLPKGKPKDKAVAQPAPAPGEPAPPAAPVAESVAADGENESGSTSSDGGPVADGARGSSRARRSGRVRG